MLRSPVYDYFIRFIMYWYFGLPNFDTQGGKRGPLGSHPKDTNIGTSFLILPHRYVLIVPFTISSSFVQITKSSNLQRSIQEIIEVVYYLVSSQAVSTPM